jgi:hypothetical protein
MFLTFAGVIALAVGTMALGFPQVLLASKGVVIGPAVVVWVREVGVALLAIGVMAMLVRRAPDSAAVRAFLVGNAVLQAGLFPIEIAAYQAGTITLLSGVVPNSVLHLLLASGFSWFAWRTRVA